MAYVPSLKVVSQGLLSGATTCHLGIHRGSTRVEGGCWRQRAGGWGDPSSLNQVSEWESQAGELEMALSEFRVSLPGARWKQYCLLCTPPSGLVKAVTEWMDGQAGIKEYLVVLSSTSEPPPCLSLSFPIGKMVMMFFCQAVLRLQ